MSGISKEIKTKRTMLENFVVGSTMKCANPKNEKDKEYRRTTNEKNMIRHQKQLTNLL